MGVNEFSSHLVKTVFCSLLLYFFFVMWFFLPLVYLFSCFFCFLFFFFFVCPCVLFFLVSSPSILKILLWLLTLSFRLPSYVLTFLFLFFFCSHPLFSPILFLGLSLHPLLSLATFSLCSYCFNFHFSSFFLPPLVSYCHFMPFPSCLFGRLKKFDSHWTMEVY